MAGHEIRTLAVIGTGLIGASTSLAARRAGIAEVRGFDADAEALRLATERGAVDPARSLEACVAGADVAVVCAPLGETPSLVLRCLEADASVVVTDVASAKAGVVHEVGERAGAAAARFVGGHPMTGSERSGPDAASPALLDGAVWVVCGTPRTDGATVETVEALARALGAHPVRMDAARHDRLVALVSHLPQIASTALMRVAAVRAAGEPEVLMLAAGGFRDLTRLAASNPELWPDVLLANTGPVREALEVYADALRSLGDLLERGDREMLVDVFRRSRDARLALAAKPQAKVGVAILVLPIPDRPGVLADVTAVLGARGINIEDVEIVHSAEGARGTLHLTVREPDAAVAVAELEARGYEVGRLA